MSPLLVWQYPCNIQNTEITGRINEEILWKNGKSGYHVYEKSVLHYSSLRNRKSKHSEILSQTYKKSSITEQQQPVLTRTWGNMNHSLLVQMLTSSVFWENNMGSFQKYWYWTFFNPAILLLGIYPRTQKNLFIKDIRTPMFIIHNNPNVETVHVPKNRWMD